MIQLEEGLEVERGLEVHTCAQSPVGQARGAKRKQWFTQSWLDSSLACRRHLVSCSKTKKYQNIGGLIGEFRGADCLRVVC